jgi:hypothetical protein
VKKRAVAQVGWTRAAFGQMLVQTVAPRADATRHAHSLSGAQRAHGSFGERMVKRDHK